MEHILKHDSLLREVTKEKMEGKTKCIIIHQGAFTHWTSDDVVRHRRNRTHAFQWRHSHCRTMLSDVVQYVNAP